MHTVNQMRLRKSSQKARVLGISLVEVLVSVLLAAIGLLALSGANVMSIRYSKMSQYRGTATMLAADLAERMRVNASDITLYGVASTFALQATLPTTPLRDSCDVGPPTSNTYSSITCGPVAMAGYDLVNWRTLVRSQLPEGSVFITTTAFGAVPKGADVWIAWRDPAVANDAENNTDSRNLAKECPSGLSLTQKSVRCSYFRINI